VHHGREAVGHALAVTVFVVDALAFDVAELAQSLAEAMPHWGVVDDADARDFRGLLCARRERPGSGRAAEQHDKRAPSHPSALLRGVRTTLNPIRNTAIALLAAAARIPHCPVDLFWPRVTARST